MVQPTTIDQRPGVESADRIRRLPRQERNGYPLSFAQQRMWFMHELAPASPAYNGPFAMRLRTAVKVSALKRAFDQIVMRHESLRTLFRSKNGKPYCVIMDAAEVQCPVVDWRGLASAARIRGALRFVKAEARRPFDLQSGPLLRIFLSQISEDDYVLLVVTHHIVSDYWSASIVMSELSALYDAEIQATTPELAANEIQYVDYTVWQRKKMSGRGLSKHEEYWKQQLADMAVTLELAHGRSRPAVQMGLGAQHNVFLPASLVHRLEGLALGDKATLFMVLLASFEMLLYRYSGQESFGVGAPSTGRNRQELQGIIGLFVNTLVFRAEFGEQPTFRELLRRVRTTAIDAFEHQEMPFDILVEKLHPARSSHHAPFFQTMFVFQNFPSEYKRAGALRLEPFPVDMGMAQNDLVLWIGAPSLHGETGGLRARFNYDTALFDEASIVRMAGHWLHLLGAVAGNPDRAIGELALLPEPEKFQVLNQWNNTETPWLDPWRIQDGFQIQAEERPDALALCFEPEHVSYGELNRRASILAQSLAEQGVGPEQRVGILMERSPGLVIALLAVLKAGAAFVPLDPDYPEDRLQFMLKDSGIGITIVHHGLQQRLPEPGPVIDLDIDRQPIGVESSANLSHQSEPDGLAYIIYTSGSTGLPKGAMNTHGGIGNRLLWMQMAYGLDRSDRVLQKTPVSFDVSVWEFFWPLIVGATMVLSRPGGHRDPGYLANLIESEAISTVHFVPSVLQRFIDVTGPGRCESLKRVFCSGEALSQSLQDRFFELYGAELHNLYGPTEAAVDVTYWACQRGNAFNRVPIGRPISNTQIYILDGGLQPVPVGIQGELYIGGKGLARGYVNRSDLTASRFLPDPFAKRPGERIYRTGDLARWTDQGQIDYLGRCDQQVKIRGCRIELGEVAACLRQHKAIRDSVVIDRDTKAGEKQLQAYIVFAEGETPSNVEIRAFLRKQLPEYMIPSLFVPIDQVPVNSNGKFDRTMLPDPALTPSLSSAEFIEPRSSLELEIASIWQEVLGIKSIGINDDFFELGGHSLMAAQIMSRVSDIFHVSLPLDLFFQFKPTIAGLIDAIQEYETSS